ncbi:hypothetical protein [Desulfopila inferna]|uniref:hypothetical protein n=1 Tax=Desulfopila inferna TaxID=468528 RepID=UPI00196588EC|nr:hypothetical protein [Desulfopila inferna]MBM9603186.1 hypothetical protein [Desulfopila inferna]
MKLRPEKVFEIIGTTNQIVEKMYENVLAVHEKQYGQAKIYSDLSTVLRKNLFQLQGMI